MLFAHAPVVLRSFTGRAIAYHPLFYVVPLILHLSLAVPLAGRPTLRLADGLGNAAAIALFAAVAVWRLE